MCIVYFRSGESGGLRVKTAEAAVADHSAQDD